MYVYLAVDVYTYDLLHIALYPSNTQDSAHAFLLALRSRCRPSGHRRKNGHINNRANLQDIVETQRVIPFGQYCAIRRMAEGNQDRSGAVLLFWKQGSKGCMGS